MGLTTSERQDRLWKKALSAQKKVSDKKALIEKIAENLFLDGLIQAEQQATAIEIINKTYNRLQ